MAEYYALLTKAVSGLETNSKEARQAIYDKARHALIVQLKAISPPLNPSEISRQRLELEEAVRKVEREAAAGSIGVAATAARAMEAALAEPPGRAEARPRPPAPARESLREPVVPVSPRKEDDRPPLSQSAFRRVTQEAADQRAAASAGTEKRAGASLREPLAEAPAAEPVRARVPEPATEDDVAARFEQAAEAAAGRIEQATPPPVQARAAAAAPPPPPPPPKQPAAQEWSDSPPLAADDDTLDDIAGDRPARGRRGRRAAKAEAAARAEAAREPDEDSGDYYAGAGAKPSRLPMIIMVVLILAVIGALGAVGWTYRETVLDLIASFESGDGGDSQPPAVAAGSPPGQAGAPGKADDRLLTPERAAEAPVRPLGAQERPAAAQPPAVQAADVPEFVEPDPSVEVAAADPEPGAVRQFDPAAESPATPVAAEGVAVAQKAILYEEPTQNQQGGQVTQVEAAVTWRFIAAGSDGPMVEARIQVPERQMNIVMTIKQNRDQGLPASHMIEIFVDVPPDFIGKGVQAIPRLVFKPTEESRGTPLIGQPMKVMDGVFWIALSADQNDARGNVTLITDRDWIDLPLLYDTGQRAIVTFEKGSPGEAAVNQALEAWGRSEAAAAQ